MRLQSVPPESSYISMSLYENDIVDSDTKCTLCGVSLNIARLRTIDEPREYAWSPYSSATPGKAFAWNHDGERDDLCPSDGRDCQGQKGCMAAFREDVAWRERGMRGRHKRDDDNRTWEDIVFDRLEGQRVDFESSEDRDDNWTLEDNEGNDPMSGEEMQYESGSVSDSCETEDEEMSLAHEDGSGEGEEYRDWIANKLTAPEYPSGPYRNPNIVEDDINGFRKMQQLAEEFRAKVPTEVRLPWVVLVPSPNEALGSKIGNDTHPPSRRGSEPGAATAPWSDHALNVLGCKKAEAVWEHVSGPDCCCTAGYSGSRISIEEMLNCNVVQGILQRHPQWKIESTDEDWEVQSASRWYLTGIKDNIDANQNLYYDRHETLAQRFDFGEVSGGAVQIAMAFHPCCLEVFKRVSLKRTGHFDINALGDWWATAAWMYDIWEFDRHEDIKIGAGLEAKWAHSIGTEYLAANPCFVPALKKLLVSCKKSPSGNQSRRALHDFPDLPVEIQHSIVSYLELKDIASLSSALPSFRITTKPILENLLQKDMPYLWEFWCDLPYSKWACTTAAEIKEAQASFDEQEEEISRVLDVLQEEGYDEAYAEYKTFWDENRVERKAKSQAPLRDKPSDRFEIGEMDIARFLYELEKAQTEDQIKGLRNRARIWVDCNMILDRVKAFKEEGMNRPHRHGRHRAYVGI